MPSKTPDPRLAPFTDDEIHAEYLARLHRISAGIQRAAAARQLIADIKALGVPRRDTPDHRCSECRYCGRGRCTSTQVYPSSTVCFQQSKKVPGIYYAVNPTAPSCEQFQPQQQ